MSGTMSIRRARIEARGLVYKKPSGKVKGPNSKSGKSGKGGKRHSAFQHKHFICWDGEGIDDPTKPDIETDKYIVKFQNYALLMNNEGVEVVDPNGISTQKCLDTIMNSTEDDRAIHVCFGASYDINMMLKDLPEEDLIKLHDHKAGVFVDYNQYNLEYRPRKSLTIREYANPYKKSRWNEKTQKWERWYKRSITLWDVLGFFGCKFVDALRSYFTSGNRLPLDKEWDDLIDEIEAQKNRRGVFTEEELLTTVKPYCKKEVDALCKLMNTLHEHIDCIGLKLARWDGAGAAAAALLKRENVKQYYGRDITPKEVDIISEYAYFGGRSEVFRYGNYEGIIYREDINSAYPAEMAELEDLSQGRWEHKEYTQKENNVCEWGLLLSTWIKALPNTTCYLISWERRKDIEKARIGPFPWRDSRGNVFFPAIGKAWIWKPEVKVALEKMQGEYKFTIHETWSFRGTSGIKPFAFIKALFEYRKKLKKEGNGAEKEVKLTINALYGKLAQSIGYDTKQGTKPPYTNFIYAGLITSGTRAKVLEAALSCLDGVIMIATDGIYSTTPIAVQESSTKELGLWEPKTYEWMTIVASGVYWFSDKGKETPFSRGFDKDTIMRDKVLESWKSGITELACETTRFVGLGAALGLSDLSFWRTWRTVYRRLGLNVNFTLKRVHSARNNKPHKGLVNTYTAVPHDMCNDDDNGYICKMTHKFTPKWEKKYKALGYIDGTPEREYLQDVLYS